MLPLDLAPQRLLLVPERRDIPARRDRAAARASVATGWPACSSARAPAARTARLAQLRRRYD